MSDQEFRHYRSLCKIEDCPECMKERIAELEAENNHLVQEVNRLRYEVDTTRGLWCIDRNPNDMDIEWIRRNAFQLQALGGAE